MNLRQKLVEISKEIGFLEFDGHNPMYQKKGQAQGTSNYTTAAGVIRKLNAALAKHSVLLTVESEDVIFPDPKLAVVRCQVAFRDTESDEVIFSFGSGSGKDSGDKAVMKASTAAYKYAIAHALALGWGAEDPENPNGDASAKGRSSTPKARGRAKKTAPLEDLDALVAEIEAAESLDGIMKRIIKFRKDADAYTRLKEAYSTRKESLSE